MIEKKPTIMMHVIYDKETEQFKVGYHDFLSAAEYHKQNKIEKICLTDQQFNTQKYYVFREVGCFSKDKLEEAEQLAFDFNTKNEYF
ncbi:TPA: hypothetical protein ACIFCT_003571 [Acinetobacter baumannii]|uniref:Uncharacterized protein n=2 Tax=Acinetobacter baumannii TaxID=470 RepID=A0A646LXE0_ACIBA|nr:MULTISPECIES: hypothetical protein [Acinetobacter calcoaceticus/baumannii complex]EHZ7962033.1 hypothetical protein [Acinetobacter baumannii]EKU8084916.1 hypothetical protein [Acinetobacter baumannii]MBD0503084.1 hypothetical protein [Acinetobacter baumannii]MBZ0354790.1 hypothetical protein [Acinetobacter baumannii]MCW8642900.1 hypothetical protein [Acinetobacter baumannii]